MSEFKIYFPIGDYGVEDWGAAFVKCMLKAFATFAIQDPDYDEDGAEILDGSIAAQSIRENSFYITDGVIAEFLHEYGDDALMSTNFFIKNNLEDLLNYLLTVKYQMANGYEAHLFKDFRLCFSRDRDTSRGIGFSSFDCEIFINKNLPIKRLLQLAFKSFFLTLSSSDGLFIHEKKGARPSVNTDLNKVIVA